MNRIPRGLLVLIVIVIIVPLAFMFLFKRVAPTEIGVKRVQLGGVGIVKQDYDAGFHLGVTGLHVWEFLPRGTHFVHFVANAGDATPTTMWERTLGIRTTDQNETEIDATVPYRIKPGEAHIIVEEGLRLEYKRRVTETIKDVLRAQLAQLTSEDLQDTETRLQKAREIVPLLNVQLAKFHVEVDQGTDEEPGVILIRRVSFKDPDYEAQLQEKQFLPQREALDSALALVANEEKVTNSIEREIGAAEARLTGDWNVRFQEAKSLNDVEISKIKAMATIYESTRRGEAEAQYLRLVAEGQLALDQARALRDQLRNAALGTRGGRIYLALEAAKNLDVPSVTLNSNDPRVPLIMDLDELTNVLLGNSPD